MALGEADKAYDTFYCKLDNKDEQNILKTCQIERKDNEKFRQHKVYEKRRLFFINKEIVLL